MIQKTIISVFKNTSRTHNFSTIQKTILLSISQLFEVIIIIVRRHWISFKGTSFIVQDVFEGIKAIISDKDKRQLFKDQFHFNKLLTTLVEGNYLRK